MVATFTTAIRGWLQKSGKRLEQTKLGLVWLARISVHTPLGERLLQLASKALQHAGWFTILSLQTRDLVFYYNSIIILSFFKIVEILNRTFLFI